MTFDVARRCGFMADAVISAKIGPQSRFFSRERVDEIVVLFREAEKKIINLESELRVASNFSQPVIELPDKHPIRVRAESAEGERDRLRDALVKLVGVRGGIESMRKTPIATVGAGG